MISDYWKIQRCSHDSSIMNFDEMALRSGNIAYPLHSFSLAILDGIMRVRGEQTGGESLGYLTVYKCEIWVQNMADL